MTRHVRCGHCGGTGLRPLTGVYADTLVLLRAAGEVTGADLARRARCKATAMNNRLAVLERHGPSTSRRYGHKRLYRAKG